MPSELCRDEKTVESTAHKWTILILRITILFNFINSMNNAVKIVVGGTIHATSGQSGSISPFQSTSRVCAVHCWRWKNKFLSRDRSADFIGIRWSCCVPSCVQSVLCREGGKKAISGADSIYNVNVSKRRAVRASPFCLCSRFLCRPRNEQPLTETRKRKVDTLTARERSFCWTGRFRRLEREIEAATYKKRIQEKP